MPWNSLENIRNLAVRIFIYQSYIYHRVFHNIYIYIYMICKKKYNILAPG